MSSRTSQLALGLFASTALGGACLLAQGPLPGDVTATRLLQALVGDSTGWARVLTEGARTPGLWLTLLVAAGLVAVRGHRLAPLAAPLALALAQLADRGLRAVLFAPRPDPALVQVASPGAGSGLPSTFALVFGALFGVVLLARPRDADGLHTADGLVRALAAALIAAGCGARIVLAGHWTSQVLASLALAFAIALVALAAIDILAARSKRQSD